MAFCSAVTLCFAAICAVVSAALLAIAFSTDNWQVISVDREKIKVSIRFLNAIDLDTQGYMNNMQQRVKLVAEGTYHSICAVLVLQFMYHLMSMSA